MIGKRINEYDVIVSASPGEDISGFVKALRKVGLKSWKLRERTYQVSFDGFAELRTELPAIGIEYTIE